MGKRAVWFEDDLEERLKAVHEAMKKDPVLRNLRLKWADALKLLLRGALDSAELDYMGTLPEGVDPEEALQALSDQYERRRAIVKKIHEEWVAEFAKTGKVPPKKPDK